MNRGFKYTIYAAGFLLALAVSAYLTTLILVKNQPEVDVPNITGQDGITALKILSDLGLNLKVHAVDFSDTVPKDHIISQDPEPGSRLKKKREVKVVLSKGSATAPTPDLRELSLEQARSVLEQSRLELGLITYTYGVGPKQGLDRVLAQAPEGLIPVNAGTRVNLLLSLGPHPEYIVMPDLTGQPYSLALFALDRAGLVLGRLETDTRSNWPEESVVVQEPAPGSRAAKGSLVRLTVNLAEDAELEEYRLQLLEYPVSYGLLRREVKIRVTVGPYLWDLYEKWHGPGELVRLVTLVRGRPRAQVFEDGEEKSILKTDLYNPGVRHD